MHLAASSRLAAGIVILLVIAGAPGSVKAQSSPGAAPDTTWRVAPDSVAASASPPPAGPALQKSGALAGMLRADRLQHASLAFAIGAGAGLVTEEPVAAAGTAAAFGLAKEMWDRSHGGFDAGDLWADLAGAALAAWATWALTR